MSDSILQLQNVHKNFGTKGVLFGVDFSLRKGSVVGLLGNNGAGKTTMLKCALGLLRPSVGSASVFGEDAWDLSPQAKERLGYVSQEPNIYPWMKVRQVIAYTAAFYSKWNHELVARLVAEQQLPLEDRVGPLSVGQLQKLAIILALGHEPELLILDEPVASLDPSARRLFLQTLLQITEAGDRTILFSTHITSDLERVANEVAVLRDGKIAFHDELDALKDRVKRLRLTAPRPLPASFAVPGSLRCEVQEETALLTVENFNEPLVRSLRETWNAEVDVQDLNLEEIFLEMHR